MACFTEENVAKNMVMDNIRDHWNEVNGKSLHVDKQTFMEKITPYCMHKWSFKEWMWCWFLKLSNSILGVLGGNNNMLLLLYCQPDWVYPTCIRNLAYFDSHMCLSKYATLPITLTADARSLQNLSPWNSKSVWIMPTVLTCAVITLCEH